MDQLLAPVALYPDALLAQILMAATYPLEVVQAARWVQAYPNVQGPQLEAAMQQQPWDPSVKSLTALPQVLAMMSAKLDWTQKVGDAFLAQEQDVMATVQTLRAKARAAGYLQSILNTEGFWGFNYGISNSTTEPISPKRRKAMCSRSPPPIATAVDELSSRTVGLLMSVTEWSL